MSSITPFFKNHAPCVCRRVYVHVCQIVQRTFIIVGDGPYLCVSVYVRVECVCVCVFNAYLCF
jgi:hypothetical protein